MAAAGPQKSIAPGRTAGVAFVLSVLPFERRIGLSGNDSPLTFYQ
jgi:hypothetical protein